MTTGNPNENEPAFERNPEARDSNDNTVENLEHEFHDQEVDPLRQEEHQKVQQEILSELRQAANSEARVRTFGKLVDVYGLDAIVSLFPAIGDAGSSTLAGLYLLFEANKAGLDKTSYLKIIGLQAADFFVGTIPVIGDAADYFFKASKWMNVNFEEKTKELVKQAREAGVSDADIAKITGAADKLPKIVEKTVHFAHSQYKESKAG